MLRDDYAVLSFVTANESEYVHRICGICITYTVSISTPASAVQYVGRAIDKDCIIDRILNSVSILATYFINYHFYIIIHYSSI